MGARPVPIPLFQKFGREVNERKFAKKIIIIHKTQVAIASCVFFCFACIHRPKQVYTTYTRRNDFVENYIVYCAPFVALLLFLPNRRHKMTIKRGELYYADLNPVVGSEQGGIRPVLVLQNDVGNKYSPTVIAAATTSKLTKAKLPTHIELHSDTTPLPRDSVVLLEQIRTIDKSRIRERIGELPPEIMQQINDALLLSLGFFV